MNHTQNTVEEDETNNAILYEIMTCCTEEFLTMLQGSVLYTT